MNVKLSLITWLTIMFLKFYDLPEDISLHGQSRLVLRAEVHITLNYWSTLPASTTILKSEKLMFVHEVSKSGKYHQSRMIKPFIFG